LSFQDASIDIKISPFEWSLELHIKCAFSFVDLNKYFQSEKVVILNLHEKMADTYKDLLLSYMQPNYVRQTDIENIDPANNSQFTPYENMYLGVGIMQNINSLTDPVAKQDFYEKCRRFLITSCLEIKKRYNLDR
jgi:hypothetical protein